ncbi:hypothetical protein [Pararhizobium haloflavum]|uniref:hypothetical protein n=1 Tax=Pararhizobium haloflavum TaxID=2037914 RepID=UPI00130003AE|nr:hypothetical protein [Pararhizobium haloflavum]
MAHAMQAVEAQHAFPRFMTDDQLRAYFGLSDRALQRLRATRAFPQRDNLINKTDRRAVELFFDRRAGIASSMGVGTVATALDGDENFDDQS